MKSIVFGFLFISFFGFSQTMTQKEFTYNEFLGFVKKYHPMVKSAALNIGAAQANLMMARGGFVKPKYMAVGGLAKGADKIPAMLSPGEFVMSKYAVNSYGVDKLKAMNNRELNADGVYNYSINVNVKSGANPDEIARAVMTQIKQVDSQRIRGQRVS